MLPLITFILIYSTILVPDNYRTIQGAVNNASPGDVVVVREGEYKENILISKPLSIKSDKGPDHTTVRAAVPGNPVFKVSSADNVEIKDFTVTGSTFSGIYLYKSNYGKISGNKAAKNGSGIILYSSNDNTLTNNSADSNEKYGIYLESSHRNTLEKSSASSNNDKGVFLSFSNYNNVADNDINVNAWNGILLWESGNNVIKGNRILRNSFGFVASDGSKNNELTGNSTWANIYLIMPPILAYIGIILYLIQRRVLRAVYGA